LLHLADDLFELYDDARTYQLSIYKIVSASCYVKDFI
jgi:hypothetical protein